MVVFHSPPLDLFLCVRQRREPVVIQALITESPVEALDMAVLHRFARLNVQQRDLPFLAPNDKVSAREFRPVIGVVLFLVGDAGSPRLV